MIKLGEKVRDSITGFEGIVVGKCEYLNGCISLEVQGTELSSGSPTKAQWIDEQRLTNASTATAGGPQEHPPEMHP